MFRQEVLESLTKVMKKVLEKISQVVGFCFSESHRGTFFSIECYTQEKDSYFFNTLVKDKNGDNVKNKSPVDLIDSSEFLFKPKLAVQNQLLSNSS